MSHMALLAGRDLLVSSHAGTRLPIAVFSSQGAPPPMGSCEQCFAFLLSNRILKCRWHGESSDDSLHDAAQMAAFRLNVGCGKDAGHHGDAGEIRPGEFQNVIPVDTADGDYRNRNGMAD